VPRQWGARLVCFSIFKSTIRLVPRQWRRSAASRSVSVAMASLEQKPCHFSHAKMAEDHEGEAPRSSAKLGCQDERKVVGLRRSLEPQSNDALRRDLAEVTSAANEGLQRCLWWTRIRQLRAATAEPHKRLAAIRTTCVARRALRRDALAILGLGRSPDVCAVPVALTSSAEPRNDQVRANRGNENGNKQPVHFEAPPKPSIPQTQAHALIQNFVFCNRGKRRLRPGPGFCVLQQRERDPASVTTPPWRTPPPGSRARRAAGPSRLRRCSRPQ
jgi:hypothetical protein